MAERGAGSTILCPGCKEQHQATYRLEGLPVLACPSIIEPGDMRMRQVPRTQHTTGFVILIGTETETVECPEGHAVVKHKLADLVCAQCEAAAKAEAAAAPETDSTTRRRRTA